MRQTRAISLIFVPLLLAAAVFVTSIPAWATGSTGGRTVKVTINLPALVLDNLCNADVVNLSGTADIIVTTTPRRNGGYAVRSTFSARDLRGERIAPLPTIGYRGDDVENAYSYYAPPPQPSTHRVVHWTKLIPEGNAPTMWLVVVIRETIAVDGTPIVSAERAYLVCRYPDRDDWDD
jgi:hypothetical protein